MEYILLTFLCALTLAPAGLIILGLIRLRKPNGVVLYAVGTLFYAFSIPAACIENKTAAFLSGLLLCFASYHLFKWLYYKKSRHCIDYAKCFLASIESSDYPSCTQYILTRIDHLANSTSESISAKDIPKAVKLAILEISFVCLGSSEFRDVFGEIDHSGMQMLNIFQKSNQSLLDDGIISDKVYAENEEAIQQQIKPFFTSL